MLKKLKVTILLVMLIFAGCISDNKIADKTPGSDKETIVKNVDLRSGEASFSLSKNMKGYTLLKDGVVEETRDISGSSLLLTNLTEGNYEIIFKYSSLNGDTIKTNPYSFAIKGSNQKIELQSVEGIENGDKSVSFNFYLKNNENYEVYLKDAKMNFYDESGNDISSNFIETNTLAPAIIKSNEEKKIGLNYGYKDTYEQVYGEVSLNGYTEKNRQLVCLANKRTLTRVISQNQINVAVRTDKARYINGDKALITYSVYGIKKGEVTIKYNGTSIKREFAENKEYGFEMEANKDYKNIEIEIAEFSINKNMTLDIANIENIEISYALSNQIYIDKNFELTVKIPSYINKENIKCEFSKGVSVLADNNYSYQLKVADTNENYYKIYYKSTLIKTIIFTATKEEKIKYTNLSFQESVEKIDVSFGVKVSTTNMYRFKNFELSEGYTILDNKSTNYELISSGTNNAQIILTIRKKDSTIPKKIVLVYEEIESGDIIKSTIF